MRKPGTYRLITAVWTSLWLLSSPAGAQTEPVFRALADTTFLRIGEQTSMQLEYQGTGEACDIHLPLFYDTITAGIEILEYLGTDTIPDKDDGTFTLRAAYRITSFDSGYYEIHPRPALRIIGNDTQFIACEPFMLTVFSVTVEDGDEIRDIKPPFKVRLTFREVLPWLLWGFGLLLLGASAWYYFRSRKRGKPILQIFTRPVLPPHIKALDAFEQLRRKKLWQEGRVKEFHSELTDILRTYLDERYQLPAMEMVSGEIMEGLQRLEEVPPNLLDPLRELFTLADLVKFAKVQPLPDENDKSLRQAIDFVKCTRPMSELQAERDKESPARQNGTEQTEAR